MTLYEQLRQAAERLMFAEWQEPQPEMLFGDGDQYLVAVETQSNHRSDQYYWEYAVVTAHCDSETPVSFTVEGESWGWDWDCVRFYIPLSEFRCGAKPKLLPFLLADLERAERMREALEKIANELHDASIAGGRAWDEAKLYALLRKCIEYRRQAAQPSGGAK